MARNVTVSGGQVGQTLAIAIMFDGTDCAPGDKWRLSAAGVTFAPDTAQEIPAGATSPHTLTWRSATPLTAGLAGPMTVELNKEHGTGASLMPVQTFQVTIAPAATPAPTPPAPPANPAPGAGTPARAPANPPTPAAPAAPALPQPLQVQVVGEGFSRWFYSAGMVGWLGGLVILLVVLAFLWVVLYVISPTAMNGLSGGTPAAGPGQSTVVTEVKQTTISNDATVLQEAAKASANISH